MKLNIMMAACIVAFSFAAEAEDYEARMAKEHKNDKPLSNPLSNRKPSQPVVSQIVTPSKDNGSGGYLSIPSDKKGSSGVLIIHEWWGLNQNIKNMADLIAGEGYIVYAVDMYSGEVAKDAKTARNLMGKVFKDTKKAHQTLEQALQYLRGKGATRIAVWGWCFGGAWSLNASLAFPKEIDATVIYYGRLQTDKAKLKDLNMPILGIFGGKDTGIPLATVKEFESNLKDLKKDATIKIYPEASHAFANPSGTRYQEKSATDAWELTLKFLKKNLMR